jgi:hypothetical protein
LLPGDPYDYFQKCVREGKLTDVGSRGRQTLMGFREVPEEGAILIGFNVGLGKFGNNDIVGALQPVYLTRNGEKLGAWYGKPPANDRLVTVRAKPGYAVSGIGLRSGLLIDAIAVEIARLELAQGRLDRNDILSTKLIGGPGGNPTILSGNGAVIVGVYGHQDEQGTPCSLGLITVRLP